MEKSFDVLILGSDFNAYYMARCYHELYNKKVNVISKKAMGVVSYSKIVNFKEVEDFENPEIFVTTLNSYAKNQTVEKIILIGTSDELVRLIIENKEKDYRVFFVYCFTLLCSPSKIKHLKCK